MHSFLKVISKYFWRKILERKELIKQNLFPIEKFDFNKLSEHNCISFTGSLIQHPYEEDKFILICDPLSDHTQFIE